MRVLHRCGVCALALAAGFGAMQLEPAVLRDLAYDGDGGRLTVGAVKVPLWSGAWAQTPDTFSLENVAFTLGSATYEAKRIEISGLASSRADVEALLSPSGSEPFGPRMARIDAKQITVPELKVRQKVGADDQTATYKNVVLSDVAQGRVGLTTVDTTAIDVSEGKTRTSLTYGRLSVRELDMPAFARLYEGTSETASGPLSKIHGDFSIDTIDVLDQEGTSLRIGRFSGRDFLARPTRASWSGSTALFAELADKDELSADEQTRLITTAADMLSAFDVAFAEATGIELKAPAGSSAGNKEKPSEATTRVSRIAYTSATGAQPADLRVEGIEAADRDGRVKIDTLSLTGFSFQSTLGSLKDFQSAWLEEIDPAAARALVPTIGTLHVSGVDIDTLSETDKGQTPERVKATLKDFELTADNPFNGVPTNFKVGLQNLAMELPAKSSEDGIKDLVALGYKNLDLSLGLAARWNEAGKEIAISEFSVQGQELGRISLTGLLGNISKDAFDPDTAVASVALIGARAKSLEMTVENTGLFDRYLAKAAKDGKTTPESLRRTYGAIAAVGIPSMLGNSEQAKSLGQAVARFIAKPGRLTISAQAKEAEGLAIAEAVMFTGAVAALQKLNVTAVAE
jgi:hypothetical protein